MIDDSNKGEHPSWDAMRMMKAFFLHEEVQQSRTESVAEFYYFLESWISRGGSSLDQVLQ